MRSIWFLIPFVLLGPLAMDMYLPALPHIKADLAASDAVIQWSLSLFVLGFGLCQLVVGEVSVRVGRVATLLSGNLIFLVSTLMCAMTESYQVLVAARFGQALGACCCMVTAMASVRGLTKSEAERTQSYSAIGGCTAVAPIMAPVVGAFCIEAAGTWRSVFLVLALCAVAGFAFVMPRLRLFEDMASRSSHQATLRYMDIMRSSRFWTYAVFTASGMTVLFTFFSLAPAILLQHYGVSTRVFALLFGCCAASFLVGNLLGPRLSRRFGMHPALVYSQLLLAMAGIGIACTTLPLSGFISMMMVVEFAVGVSFGPAMSGAMADFESSSDRAAALQGFQQFILSFAIGTLFVLLGKQSIQCLGLLISTVAVLAVLFSQCAYHKRIMLCIRK